jgi:hypothetical protein
MEDDLKKNEKWKTTSKKIKRKTTLKKREKKEGNIKTSHLSSIPLKFRGKPFLGLA